MRLCTYCLELVDQSSAECPHCGRKLQCNDSKPVRKRHDSVQPPLQSSGKILQQSTPRKQVNSSWQSKSEQEPHQRCQFESKEDNTVIEPPLPPERQSDRSNTKLSPHLKKQNSIQQQPNKVSGRSNLRTTTDNKAYCHSDNTTQVTSKHENTSTAMRNNAPDVTRPTESKAFLATRQDSGQTTPKPVPRTKSCKQPMPQDGNFYRTTTKPTSQQTTQKPDVSSRPPGLKPGVGQRNGSLHENYSETLLQTEMCALPSPKDPTTKIGGEIPWRTDNKTEANDKSSQQRLESQEQQASKKHALVVAAIDFGTTYSGYAYSFRGEYKKDPTKINMNMNWNNGECVSEKTKTSILFNSDKSFNSFGYDAETKYAELADENKHHSYIFFEKFKMKLFKQEENKRKFRSNMVLKDVNGNQMRALDVFAESIKYMVNHFKSSSRVQHLKLLDRDIHWVLTIPAIWSDEAKQFMREAAQMAGIPGDLLTLAYEPEAAALCCKEMIVQRCQGLEDWSLDTFRVGQRFIILDCGGGTVDVTCYEILDGWCLKELERPTGGPWGGTMVDNEFMKMLKNIIGETVWDHYLEKYPEDALDIERKFEAKKKNLTDIVTIAFPSSLTKLNIVKSLNESKYSSYVKSIKDKLRFDRNLIVALFNEAVDAIVQHIKKLLSNRRMENIHSILMVGGFSQSDLLYQRIKDTFSHQNVICPPEAVSAIVKGAVMYGHNPELIRERKCPRTYGISTNVPYDSRVHPTILKAFIDGEAKCTDIFKPLVKIGESLTVGKSIRYIKCHPSNAYDSEATIEVYASTSDNPKFTVDDNVRLLGTLCTPIPDVNRGKNRIIVIKIEFGHTEIVVSAFEEETGIGRSSTFKCI